jgi:N-acetyl-anhydromuramyl-L-alanine amidase AmpD
MENYLFVVDKNTYRSTDYQNEETEKTNICLHATAGGSAAGAIEHLMKRDGVIVHFVVDKDGTIYQLYPLKYWGYHLGIKGSGGALDKRTVGIEIVNFGPLVLRDNNLLCSWPNDFNNKYCYLEQTHLYYALKQPWRDYTYYATYTAAQYESVSKLVAYLCATLQIPAAVLPNVNEYQLNAVYNFNGIFTHTSVRQDKSDVGPAWSWKFFEGKLQPNYDFYAANEMPPLVEL